MTHDLVLASNFLFIASHVSLPTAKDIVDSDIEEVDKSEIWDGMRRCTFVQT